MNKINTSFSYKIEENSATEYLPDSLFQFLAGLFNEGYLTIKPTKVEPYFFTNSHGSKNYQIDMSFDTEDKELIEDTFYRPKAQ